MATTKVRATGKLLDGDRCNGGFAPPSRFVPPRTNPLAYSFRFSHNSADLFLVVDS